MAPLLLLLAALSTFEGYVWLNLISADRWRSWAAGFAVLTFGVVVALIRPLRARPGLAAAIVVSVAVVMLGATVVAVFVKGPVVGRTVGVADLLFAVTALATVAAAEHSTCHRTEPADRGASGCRNSLRTTGTRPCRP